MKKYPHYGDWSKMPPRKNEPNKCDKCGSNQKLRRRYVQQNWFRGDDDVEFICKACLESQKRYVDGIKILKQPQEPQAGFCEKGDCHGRG